MSMDTKRIKEHYNKYAHSISKWQKRWRYYYYLIARYFKFVVAPDSRVLDLACGTGDLLAKLKPKFGLGIDISQNVIEEAVTRHPESNLKFVCANVENLNLDLDEKFDYIILNETLGEILDIQKLLKNISKFCSPDTRIIINQYNPIWETILKSGEKIKLKMPELVSNWISMDDIENFIYITGYETIQKYFFILFPIYIPVLSAIFNRFIAKWPVIRRLTLHQMLVARYIFPPMKPEELSCSLILTCRDEKQNIEPLVRHIPKLGGPTEILFVEGHSTDGTREEIERVITKYKDKNIKLFIQDGIGQKDAFRKGLEKSTGELIIWLEADMTTPPEDVENLWDAYARRKGEYINGTRLVYKMPKGSMPLINLIGNRLFGNVFTGLLGQRFTDTLCGLKAISRKNWEKIIEQSSFFGNFDPFGDFELIFGSIKNNLKVSEVPVKYFPRNYGETKTHPLKHGWLLFKMYWVAYKKFKLF